MASLKIYKTTSHYKRKFRRSMHTAVKHLRSSEVRQQCAADYLSGLIRVTLRARSGNHMRKAIRSLYPEIHSCMKQLEK